MINVLTVNVRSKATGVEEIYPVSGIEFTPLYSPNKGNEEPSSPRNPGAGILLKFGEGCSTHIGGVSGSDYDVFVMNSEGNTVARYVV